jgi:hypothetical protein
MRKLAVSLIVALPLLSGGCIAKTAVDIVTLPVKAGSKAVDWTTTSQDESDRNYGRKMREKEAREGKERKKHEKECQKHPDSCGEYEGYRASDPDPK